MNITMFCFQWWTCLWRLGEIDSKEVWIETVAVHNSYRGGKLWCIVCINSYIKHDIIVKNVSSGSSITFLLKIQIVGCSSFMYYARSVVLLPSRSDGLSICILVFSLFHVLMRNIVSSFLCTD